MHMAVWTDEREGQNGLFSNFTIVGKKRIKMIIFLAHKPLILTSIALMSCAHSCALRTAAGLGRG